MTSTRTSVRILRNAAPALICVACFGLNANSSARAYSPKNADEVEVISLVVTSEAKANNWERRHIARELHDSAGQLLTVLAMDLSTLVRNAQEKAPEIAESAEQARELVHQLTSEIRTTSYLLHPPLLDEEGLQAAISLYVRGLIERSGLDITVNISKGFGRLPRDTELAIFRLVQECLTNIHRHSGSKVAAIHLKRAERCVFLEVEDAGSGISPEKLLEIQSHGAGVGIRGMRERVLLCGGEMKIESEGRGTKISITLPT